MYHLTESFEELTHKFFIKLQSKKPISRKNIIALSGGRSIKPFCEIFLTKLKSLSTDYLASLSFVLADERFVDKNSKDLNYHLLFSEFFEPAIKSGYIDSTQIRQLVLDQKTPGNAASDYNTSLEGESLFAAFLGVGEDGHVASLFPSHQDYIKGLESEDKYIVVDNSPKPPPQRISAAPRFLKEAEFKALLFVGESKEQAYQNFIDGNLDYKALPVNFFRENDNKDKNCTIVLRQN